MIEKNNGLTLIECLLMIALSCILLFSAVMAYREFINKNQLSTLVEKLSDALAYARDAAITLQSTITFCPKNEDGTCGSNWQKGQWVIDEKNQNVLRVLPVVPSQYHFFWRSTLGDSTALQWRSNGFTRGQQGSFFICGRKGYDALSARVIILRTGRIRVEMGKISGCNDHDKK